MASKWLCIHVCLDQCEVFTHTVKAIMLTGSLLNCSVLRRLQKQTVVGLGQLLIASSNYKVGRVKLHKLHHDRREHSILR